MKMSSFFGFSALGAISALLCATTSHAQSAPQMIQVPPGYTAILLPQAAPSALPDPFAMLRQAGAMMAQMQAQQAAMIQAAFSNAGQAPANGASGEVITFTSDGTHSCTQQIIYPGNGAPAKVQLTATGNGCVLQGVNAPTVPTALPNTTVPKRAPAPLVVAERLNEKG